MLSKYRERKNCCFFNGTPGITQISRETTIKGERKIASQKRIITIVLVHETGHFNTDYSSPK